MASEVDIVNLALARLGETPNISSINPPEGSAHAEKAARFYTMARDRCVESHNWNFATKRVLLAGLPNPASPWKYAYAIPNDILRPISVKSPLSVVGSLRDFPLTGNLSNFDMPDDDLSVADYIIEGQTLLTNAPDATLRYVARSTDTTKWSPHFVDAVVWALAADLSGAIVQDAKMTQWCYSMFQQQLMNAMNSDVASIRRTNVVQRPNWIRDR